jgi:hypothetical protein
MDVDWGSDDINNSIDYIARTIRMLQEGSHPKPRRAAHNVRCHAELLFAELPSEGLP